MKLEEEMLDDMHTVGIVKVREFKGHVMKIDVRLLGNAMHFLKGLEKNGINIVEIGVENESPLLFFLDKERSVAFAISPYQEEEDE